MQILYYAVHKLQEKYEGDQDCCRIDYVISNMKEKFKDFRTVAAGIAAYVVGCLEDFGMVTGSKNFNKPGRTVGLKKSVIFTQNDYVDGKGALAYS